MKALNNISLTIPQGMFGLLGPNGAGKSTLMNILYGLYDPDDGEIFVNGEMITVSSPRDAIARGIGMVHQHFMLIPVFTVTENVMLGYEETQGLGWLDRRRAALSDVARKRLAAIFNASELGAGFQIALSDLEIRGAGNILGAEQHEVSPVCLQRRADVLECCLEQREIDLPGAASEPPAGPWSAWVGVSATESRGLEALAREAARLLSLSGAADGPSPARLDRELSARHRAALREAREALEEGLATWRAGAALDMFAEHLRAATAALDGISGRTTAEDLLDRIFSAFCLGK